MFKILVEFCQRSIWNGGGQQVERSLLNWFLEWPWVKKKKESKGCNFAITIFVTTSLLCWLIGEVIKDWNVIQCTDSRAQVLNMIWKIIYIYWKNIHAKFEGIDKSISAQFEYQRFFLLWFWFRRYMLFREVCRSLRCIAKNILL